MGVLQTYSFLDVQASIVGPGGSFALGSGSGAAEEGISVTPSEDMNNMAVGADGSAMHSLHADRSGRIAVRLLKTSPVNGLLATMLALQRSSAANHGINQISIVNLNTGDVITCQQVAFAKVPDLNYAKEGGINEWLFDAGIITPALGNGNLLN